MVTAWEVAREAVVEFGGRAVEYLSGALKMAWAKIKGENKMDKMKKAYKLHVEAEGKEMTFEEYKKNKIETLASYNAYPYEKDKTMDEYLDHFIKVYQKTIDAKEEAAQYKEEAQNAFAHLGQAQSYFSSLSERNEAHEIYRKAASKSKDRAIREAYSDAKSEAIRKINEATKKFESALQETDEELNNGLTGPVYDDDEKPVYF